MKKWTTFFAVAGLLAFGQTLRAQDAATTTAAPAAAAPANLKAEVKVGTGIESLDPTGVSESFDASVEKVVGWSKVTGAQEPTQITHVWIYKGNEIATVPLQVKSSSFRTHSRKTVSGFPGSWIFQVKDAAGNVLGEQKFEVTNTGAAPAAPAATPQ